MAFKSDIPNKKLLGIIFSIASFSTNLLAQAKSGRGEDWYYDGDGGGYFGYFLLIFWSVVLTIAISKVIFEEITNWYQRTDFKKLFISFFHSIFTFIFEVLKIVGLILIVFIPIVLIIQLIVYIDFRPPKYLEYIGRFIMSLFWLAIIKHIFFYNKSKAEIISFFKTSKGIVMGIFILFLMLVLIFG